LILREVFGEDAMLSMQAQAITDWLIAEAVKFRSGSPERAALRVPVTGPSITPDILFESGHPWAEGPLCIWVNLWTVQRAQAQLRFDRLRGLT